MCECCQFPIANGQLGIGNWNWILSTLATFLPLLALSSSFAAELNPVQNNSAWYLPPGEHVEGDTLVVEIAPEATGRRDVRAAAEIDVSDAFAAMQCVAATVAVRGVGVSEPPHAWQGVKVQLSYTDFFGDRVYRDAALPRGTFDRTNVTVRVSPLLAPLGIPGGRVSLLLGLEGCTGRAEFDLSSLRIDREDTGIPPAVGANDGAPQSGAMTGAPLAQMTGTAARQMTGAPAAQMNDGSPFAGSAGTLHSAEGGPSLHAAAQRRPPLRGCMLPARATTEDDITVLAGWGATLARFQITRDFGKVDANSDLAEYAAWVDSLLDNLAEVLEWCAARGMKVCVDLHTPPGGKRAGDRAMNMFFQKKFADAFVGTWRRIATRFKGHPALYGYDLVNEPIQREPAPFSYWELQKRAAEAIREIDPGAAIVVESNLGSVAESYRYLSPLAMDNVIYQVHLYKPYEYTHQGVWGNPFEEGGRPLVWPDPARGWTTDHLRRVLAPVRAFQEKHRARIYVGEFSAVSWAPGAENYLRDCIALFAEYGWDWTYHAFREWGAWSVEHEPIEPGRAGPSNFRPVPDSPRKRALIEGLKP